MERSGWKVRDVRRMRNGWVEVEAVTATFRPFRVAVPFGRSSEADIVAALDRAAAELSKKGSQS